MTDINIAGIDVVSLTAWQWPQFHPVVIICNGNTNTVFVYLPTSL